MRSPHSSMARWLPRRPAWRASCRSAKKPRARSDAPPPSYAFESLVEASLLAVLGGADEAPHADGQGDHQRAHDVDHVAPSRAIGVDRGVRTGGAQGGDMASRHMHLDPLARAVMVRKVFMSRRPRPRLIPSATVLAPLLEWWEHPKLGSRYLLNG